MSRALRSITNDAAHRFACLRGLTIYGASVAGPRTAMGAVQQAREQLAERGRHERLTVDGSLLGRMTGERAELTAACVAPTRRLRRKGLPGFRSGPARHRCLQSRSGLTESARCASSSRTASAP